MPIAPACLKVALQAQADVRTRRSPSLEVSTTVLSPIAVIAFGPGHGACIQQVLCPDRAGPSAGRALRGARRAILSPKTLSASSALWERHRSYSFSMVVPPPAANGIT